MTLDETIENFLNELKMFRENKSRWIYDENGMDYNIGCWKCERCGFRNEMIPTCTAIRGKMLINEEINPNNYEGSNFCPNCGADMRTGGDE